jgi:hypothetical protein
MKKNNTNTQSWWGSFELKNSHSKQWQIGPLIIIIRHENSEWQISHERIDNFDNTGITFEITDTELLSEKQNNFIRYIISDSSDQITIKPLLADRPVIYRPNTPLSLTAGEEITLYVSSPLWVGFSAGHSKTKLGEIAIQRPSDTWFGPSTREGELCYASTTHCRLNLDEIPQRSHRANAPVVIRNLAETNLSVERINLPAPFLQLYSTPDNQLWTPKITLIREQDEDMAELVIDEIPPIEAKQATILAEPRKTVDSGVLFRAFNTIFK